jgi:hypothetical protein
MPIALLVDHGGPFALRRVIDVGETHFVGKVPEIEDRLFKPESVQVMGELDKSKFYELNSRLAKTTLAEIFGPDLELVRHGQSPATAAVAETHGLFSLGCYWAQRPSIEIQSVHDQPRIRLQCIEANQEFSLPVADIRCFAADHVTPDATMVQALNERLRRLPQVLTSIGLSRAYRQKPTQPPRHWLQINNIHLPL